MSFHRTLDRQIGKKTSANNDTIVNKNDNTTGVFHDENFGERVIPIRISKKEVFPDTKIINLLVVKDHQKNEKDDSEKTIVKKCDTNPITY